ncbi:MAG: CCA tRNA nucleotidyltransferase [Campylobacter sp.]|nr:CCA tRNA nucleotidyltransferase [Campylobacter sp.]
MLLPKKDLEIYQNRDFKALQNFLSKHTKRAYFVGGFVRDQFLGINTKDIDIEVFDIDPDKFDALMQSFGADGVGRSFFVYKWKNFDISLPRTEKKVGIGHKAFSVNVTNDEKIAAKRRDFTMNSVMIDIFSGKVLDNYDGICDIKTRTLRVVDSMTFVEDSLRVLRAVQFVARFDLNVDENSLILMKNMDLNDLSKDRISSELIKLFEAKHQHLGLKLIKELGIFEFLFGKKVTKFSELYELIKTGQNFVKNEMFFLYILINFLSLDKHATLKRLNLQSRYRRIIDEPYFSSLKDKNLLEISLTMPLSEWLGLYSQDLLNRAKKLGVYDSKFPTKVKSEDVIKDGFSGNKIKSEIKRRQNLELENYLKSKQ